MSADCIAHVNEALCRENPIDMFVTVVYADLNEASGQVRFVNAGHCEPIIAGADGKARLLKHSSNPPLGVMPGKAFKEASVTLNDGETLFLYADGVTEAFNAAGEAVLGDLERFSAGTVQADDITCLVIRRNG